MVDEGRVSIIHCLTVVRPRKNFLTLRKILRFACANYKIMHLNLFYSFSLNVSHILGDFCDILPFFLRKIQNQSFDRAKKIYFLKCLRVIQKMFCYTSNFGFFMKYKTKTKLDTLLHNDTPHICSKSISEIVKLRNLFF